MRIRTDGDKAYRMDVIDGAADFYGCNKTLAVTQACEDVPGIVAAARRVLEREDLTAEQKREIAETFNDETKGVAFAVEETVSGGPD